MQYVKADVEESKRIYEDALELLEDLGDIPEELHEKIKEEQNVQTIKSWLKLAAKAESMEQFIEQM